MENREFVIREVNEEERTVRGIAVPFDSVTDIGGYKEKFKRGAFEGSSDVKLFYGHHTPIGRITRSEDAEEGYMIEARISKTAVGDEVYTLLKDGVLDRFSVGFEPIEHQMDEDVVVRTKARLREVSIVAFPAYEGAALQEVRNQNSQVRDDHEENKNKEDISMSNEVNETSNSEVADLRDSVTELERRFAMIGNESTETKPQFRSGGEFLKALASGSREARDFATTTEADVTRPGWVSEALRRKVEDRNVINLFSRGALPASGNSIEYPFVNTDTGTVGEQEDEGDALNYLEVTLDTATAPVKTYGGYISLSRQAIERSDLAFLESSIDLMVQQYAKATNDAVRSALVSAKSVADHTLAGDTVSDWLDVVVDAAAAIEDDTISGKADFMLVSRDVFKRLAHMVDDTGRPVFNVYGAGVNNVGAANVVGSTMNVGGLEVVVDGRLAADSAFVATSEAIKVFESPGAPFRLQDENIVNLTKDFSLYGYMAVAVRESNGIQRLDVDLV